MINITYIILAHDSPNRLIRLINTLKSVNANFVVHVDKSIPVEDFLVAFDSDKQVVILKERCFSHWGSFGLVQATLNAMAYVVNHISIADRIILLSGSDYPIKSVEEIESYFDKNRESIFIEYFKIPYEKWYAKGVDRFPNFCEINETMSIYGGSQWWSFPIKVARFILNFLAHNPDYLEYFKVVTIPDESFFQTLLHNCGEDFVGKSLVCDNLRLIKWDPPYLHPRTLGLKDFLLIQQSHAMFARKFDENIDKDVLDLIDKDILYSEGKYISNPVSYDLDPVNQVVLFLTNKSDTEIIEQFNKLKRETGDHASVKMLYHRSLNETIPDALSDDEIFVFTDDILNELGYEPFIGSKLDGSNHFPLIKFFRQYPNYDFYWYVEDDIRCLQGWNTFFSYFLINRVSSDFIASHVRDFEDEPEWYWWKSLRIEDRQPNIDFIRSFNPIFRISRSALNFIDKCHARGYSGHFEVLLPSLLKSGGFKFAEFGGEGKYVLPGCQNFFYRAAYAESSGSMRTGSLRYRPVIEENEMWEPLLYHPVKLQTVKKANS
ncbi:Core-2/I-Branching enzyme [Pedobacter suwonensis]|uniref:Peptide O-xylosyltransferase n=1 Tax=Pedobacter suwonensis TaxID=332999 RepID=A0A1I0T9P4_9SPHI|nr:beta-1,6-N-acetylglucosaminyltransferase [Pedobacter suwonensis]SFA48502.1 Core-2/I-Branching enzyme [Pedobacter suwonensis]